ncbi:MAG: TM0996/MTH895 family glutaredoxin-like protein [candidate division Zixibacteria bacterium]|nr:TM0996/MTH895 family glutaredoxin-like protein [candidate division Zixibacteria bacterium]
MKLIQVLGTGCPKCEKLEALTRQAARELDLECEVLKVKDIQAIMHMGVMMTPALAVDGVVKVSGRVPSLDEIKKLIQ